MYSELGVDEFYKEYGNEYKNPHAEIIQKLLADVIRMKGICIDFQATFL